MRHPVFLLTALLLASPAGLHAAEPVLSAPAREGLRLWLDASDAGTLEVQDNAITRWRDKSGAGHDATATGKPVLVERDFNGRPAVRLAGCDGFTMPPVAKESGPITAFVVSRRLAAQAGGEGWQRLVSIRSGTVADNKPPNLCLTGEAQSGAYAPSVKVISKDGIAPGRIGIGIGIGAGSAAALHGFRGDLAEVLVYDRGFLSEGALREVTDYLAAKWGATVDRKDSGWTRTGPLGPTPEPVHSSLPLADQQNRGGWIFFEPFSDEFNGPALDTRKWEPMRKWKGRPPGLFRSSNVTLDNGCLVLTMRKETVPEMKQDPQFHDYTSAILETLRYTRYGYFEIKARPMNSAGSSSFWFAGGARTWRIEIDVFEIGGKAPGREQAYNMNAHVFREDGKDDHWNTGGVWQAPWRFADGFHVYGLEWSPQQLVYHVDGVAVRSMPNTHWHQPMRLIFDSETMPNWFGLPKDEDLPSTFRVDYVRAWKKPGWEGAIGEDELDSKIWEPLK